MSDNKQLRVGVVGMGPVGCILAAHLIEAGAHVVPCDVMIDRIDSIKKQGIRLTHTFDALVPVKEACYTPQELEMYDLDVIVVACKTPSLAKVLEQIEKIDSDKFYVVCAQNGIDNELEVAKIIGDHRTLRMVVNYAGNMSDAHTVHASFFNPPNYVAPLLLNGSEEIAGRFVGALNKTNLTTEIPEDIQDYVWEKAILNAALSALCAISRRTMKDVMEFPMTFDLVEALIDESVKVALCEGIDLGKKFRRYSIRYLKNAGHHRPSMLVDLESGHPTEIDFLNGRIVEYGRKHCVPTPLNQSVAALVHLLQNGSRA
ncbi:2-dehydropantoate 2-reductase [bacterium]|jgi:2-dehydropantoate 2-reductase|nr:2-dehydropantoate 2-reductase [bacterium]